MGLDDQPQLVRQISSINSMGKPSLVVLRLEEIYPYETPMETYQPAGHMQVQRVRGLSGKAIGQLATFFFFFVVFFSIQTFCSIKK